MRCGAARYLFWAREFSLNFAEQCSICLLATARLCASPSHQPSVTMATKKDMRRPDLSKLRYPSEYLKAQEWLMLLPVIPYQAPLAKENAADFSSAMSSTIPMAAMFTRNKYIGWSVEHLMQQQIGTDSLQGVCRLCDSVMVR